MEKLWKKLFAIAIFTLMVGWGLMPARADIRLDFTGASTSGGITTYNYNVYLTNGQQIVNGDYFTVYDIAGYITGSATFTADAGAPSASFTLSEQPSGVTPPPLMPPDTSLPNVTMTYNSSTSYSSTITNSFLLGTFSYQSSINVTAPINYAGRGTNNTDNPGAKNANFSQTVGPAAIPEPATMLLLGTGLAGLAGVTRRRMRREEE